MATHKPIQLDFVVDKLTNSIQNTISGDSFATEVLRLTKADLKQVTRKNGWHFNWKAEWADNMKSVFKLAITNNSTIIQGVLSVTFEPDHVYMHLLENVPFNVGQNKFYDGVAGNLVAHACKLSFQQGFDGFVAFTAKTQLIAHYKTTLGAYQLSGQRMIIPTNAASVLVEQYFKS
ncbi:hypothetical protein GCM10027299_07850 [Larkinella ripae]